MKWTGLNELREAYLSFFESKGHLRHKSFPLVPIDDKSLLLINAGMAPLKKYFKGESEPPKTRMTTCQKCIRTPDIERVGITARHGTFFEMLGNFSFGDYFKEEAITWAWEFCTKVIMLPEDKIWVTIYEDDDEAYNIWHDKVGVPAERIVRLGDDNFWEIGSGPCGPCSELHIDRGEEFGCGSPDCKPGCDCDRFMEFWNLVFTQFDGDGAGNYTPLAHPNIDTGMGLERLACVMQGVNNLFEVDTVRNIMAKVSELTNVKYGEDAQKDISLRVITDHIRSTSFLICDGVVPSNEGRGYVLRRLLRRAARHGRILGVKDLFLFELCDVVARENLSAYPELTEKLDYIKKVIKIEEERFAATVDSGLEMLEKLIEKAKSENSDILKGEDVFKLSDTYGFPFDLTREISEESGIKVDVEGFEKLMKEQKERARGARASMGDFGWAAENFDEIKKFDKTEFCGYTDLTASAKVLTALESEDGEKVTVILDKTPFYAEGGGQVGDTGKIVCGESEYKVTDTKKHDGIYMHICEKVSGFIKEGDVVTAVVDSERRRSIMRNHSTAHLLQSALRKVLGNHIEQAGSYVDENRLRFDFSHFTAMTTEEIENVEKLVNEWILAAGEVKTIETDIETAKSMGAIALFGEKYGDTVRLVKMGDFSTELCGGTHISNTSEAALFKVISETSVSAGTRRIEGVTGRGVLELIAEKNALINATAKEIKANNISDIPKRIEGLQNDLKEAKKTIDALNAQLSESKTADLYKNAVEVDGVMVAVMKSAEMNVDMARKACDKLKDKHSDIVVAMAVMANDKLNFVTCCGKDAVAKGAHAGNLARMLGTFTGGSGGGRPDSAVSGGKDISKVDEALASVCVFVKENLK
ncbi:MAG: alanine--tRNA ligase [Ruminococcaceae bacterium]|nr:alanine--tRNA ligase [Oscillospiraceae bacterium]